MRHGTVRARHSRESGKGLVPVLIPVDHQYRLIACFIIAPSVLLPIPVPSTMQFVLLAHQGISHAAYRYRYRYGKYIISIHQIRGYGWERR